MTRRIRPSPIESTENPGAVVYEADEVASFAEPEKAAGARAPAPAIIRGKNTHIQHDWRGLVEEMKTYTVAQQMKEFVEKKEKYLVLGANLLIPLTMVVVAKFARRPSPLNEVGRIEVSRGKFVCGFLFAVSLLLNILVHPGR